MAAPSLIMRILRLTICTRPHSNSTAYNSSCAMIIVNHIIKLASLTSAIAGLYLLPRPPLRSLLPFARSAVLVSLPHVWRSLLSWPITPPCPFVILNCIIVTLALTSGSFKLGLSSAGSGLFANLVTKMGAVHRRHMNHSPPAKARKSPALAPLQAIYCEELEKEEPVTGQDKITENDLSDDDSLAMAASDPAQTRDWHSQPASPSQKQATKCVRRAKSIDSSSMQVLYSVNRNHANRHGFRSPSPASALYTSASASASSSPSLSATTSSCSSSSYTLSTPSSPSSPSSPCSADDDGYSAPTRFDPLNGDDLSDEDLRKRIEAFISRMNAQMRREAATSSVE